MCIRDSSNSYSASWHGVVQTEHSAIRILQSQLCLIRLANTGASSARRHDGKKCIKLYSLHTQSSIIHLPSLSKAFSSFTSIISVLLVLLLVVTSFWFSLVSLQADLLLPKFSFWIFLCFRCIYFLDSTFFYT